MPGAMHKDKLKIKKEKLKIKALKIFF